MKSMWPITPPETPSSEPLKHAEARADTPPSKETPMADSCKRNLQFFGEDKVMGVPVIMLLNALCIAVHRVL